MNTIEERKSPSHADGIKRIQVGCGPKNILHDWWNVDIREFKGIDEVMDVTRPWPWKNIVDYVFGEHFLEHLTVQQAQDFLVEAGKALCIGGKIRLSTPSLEWVLKTHFKFEDSPADMKLDQTWAINRAFRGWGHQFLYSKEMLVRILESTGFQRVQFFDYGISDDPLLANLERHGGWQIEHGYPSVWVVEATRGELPIAKNRDFSADMDLKFLRYVESGH